MPSPRTTRPRTRSDSSAVAKAKPGPLRIVFLSDTFLPQVNGVTTSIANFSRELGRRGHSVMILCPAYRGRPSREMWAPNVEIVRLPSFPALLYPDFRLSPLLGLPRCLLALREFRPDVIHLQTTLAVSIDAVAAKRVFDCPLVGTNHVFLTSKEWECLAFLTKKRVILGSLAKVAFAYSRAFYNACDLCLAPSMRLIDALRDERMTARMMYLPHGVPRPASTTRDAPPRARVRRTYGLPANVVLHVGRLSSEKRVDHLLRAMALLPRDTGLLVVGDGPERRRLQVLTKKLGIADRVVFTGFIQNADLLQSGIYESADVFATASAMESQGMVLVEAMAYGLPIVAVDGGAAPEVVGKAGVLVDPVDTEAFADALRSMLASPKKRASLRAAALRQYEQFSVESLTDRLLAYYALAAQIHGKRRPLRERLPRIPVELAAIPGSLALRLSRDLTRLALRAARGITTARLAAGRRSAASRRKQARGRRATSPVRQARKA